MGLTDYKNLGLEQFATQYHAWYNTPFRHYHNVAHANDVADNCYIMSSQNPTVVLAALYHDAVYIAGVSENEKWSALALTHDARTIEKLGYHVDFDMVNRACLLIEQTTIKDHLKNARVTDPELAVLLDVDLSPLKFPYDVFFQNQRNILEENFLDSNSIDSLKKSAKFLKQFLTNREWIYHTDYARALWNQRAKENIDRFCMETGV